MRLLLSLSVMDDHAPGAAPSTATDEGPHPFVRSHKILYDSIIQFNYTHELVKSCIRRSLVEWLVRAHVLKGRVVHWLLGLPARLHRALTSLQGRRTALNDSTRTFSRSLRLYPTRYALLGTGGAAR